MAKYYTKKTGKKSYKKKSYRKKQITKKYRNNNIFLKKRRFSKKAGSAKRPLTDPELFQSEKIQRQDINNNDSLLVETTNRAINIENSIPQSNLDTLMRLGFEDGELEMFFSEFGNRTNELIDKYLQISRQYPGYETLDQALNSDYSIPNTELTKHDIAEQVLESYYD